MTGSNILIRETTPDELRSVLREMIQEEFQQINLEIQKVLSEDRLISSGVAARYLGVCKKVFSILVRDGHFTTFHHLSDRRYKLSEILKYRNRYRTEKAMKHRV